MLSLLQYLTKKLGVNTVQFGYLQTTFAIVQLAGGPLFGRFGDLYGGRAALTLAFASSALTYGLLGMAWNIPFLFLSRMPSVFMHAMQGKSVWKFQEQTVTGCCHFVYGMSLSDTSEMGDRMNWHMCWKGSTHDANHWKFTG